MKNWLTGTLLRGLSILVPVAVAMQVVLWLGRSAENLALHLIQDWLPSNYYVPGLGIGLLLGVIFLTGLLMYPWISRKLLEVTDHNLRRIPLFGAVYAPVRDLMELFSGSVERQLGQPVMIKAARPGHELLGFITRENADGLPEGLLLDGHYMVFIPGSTEIGGYCISVPAGDCRPVDISTEDALRWALTAGLSSPRPRK